LAKFVDSRIEVREPLGDQTMPSHNLSKPRALRRQTACIRRNIRRRVKCPSVRGEPACVRIVRGHDRLGTLGNRIGRDQLTAPDKPAVIVWLQELRE
jgi:hypothetical protein